MTPWRKRTGLFIHAVLFCELANHANGNELAKLMKSGGMVLGWFRAISLFHTGFLIRKSPEVSQLLNSYGMTVFRILFLLSYGNSVIFSLKVDWIEP